MVLLHKVKVSNILPRIMVAILDTAHLILDLHNHTLTKGHHLNITLLNMVDLENHLFNRDHPCKASGLGHHRRANNNILLNKTFEESLHHIKDPHSKLNGVVGKCMGTFHHTKASSRLEILLGNTPLEVAITNRIQLEQV
jgi:hypothetical protein